MGYEFFEEKIICPSTPVPGINNDQSHSANICLSFKLVIEKWFQIKITGAVKKLGKIWPRES